MTFRRGAHLLTALALPLVVVGSLALAQPQPGEGHRKTKEHHDQSGDKSGEKTGDRSPDKSGQGDKNEWTEKYKDELKEHPRLGHALVDLHLAKDHLQKAPHDFGGHRADAVKACDEAIKQIQIAADLDPLSLIIATDHGHLLYLGRHFDAAIDQFQRVIEMDQGFVMAHWHLAETQHG